MSRITTARKLKEKRGTGTGADYKPWILAREFGSLGTESVFNDWKHGRPIQCLSQGEAKVYYALRWRDDVLDIREQFPLDLNLTLAIARRLGLPHPHDTKTYMTSDFLVTYNIGNSQRLKVYSIKSCESSMDNYALKNFAIEQAYWGLKGIHIEIIYSDLINPIYVSNIRQCVQYYNIRNVQSKIDLIKHLIARKQLVINMTQQYLDFPALAAKYINGQQAIPAFAESTCLLWSG